MGQNTNIEWTDHTFNAWIGCTKVSPGCANCYAATQDNFRKWTPQGWGKGKPRKRTSEANWKEPLKWNGIASAMHKEAAAIRQSGKAVEILQIADLDYRPRVFCSSLADWLDDEVPIEWLSDLLYLAVKCSALDWLMLTKRPQNWKSRLTAVASLNDIGSQIAQHWLAGNPPPNFWLGTTVENQDMADQRILHLAQIPSAVRFLSVEPMLEEINLYLLGGRTGESRTKYIAAHDVSIENGGSGMQSIDWVICGGESGSGCRPFNADWARSIRDQCAAADVAFFMKQMGGTRKPFPAIPDDLMIRQFPACPVCHGLSMLPGTEPNDDVMNTPCPQCNEWAAVKGGTES